LEKDDGKKPVLEKIFPTRIWTRINSKNKVITLRQTISRELLDRDSLSKMIATLNDLEQFFRVNKIGICETRNIVYNLFFGIIKFLYIIM